MLAKAVLHTSSIRNIALILLTVFGLLGCSTAWNTDIVLTNGKVTEKKLSSEISTLRMKAALRPLLLAKLEKASAHLDDYRKKAETVRVENIKARMARKYIDKEQAPITETMRLQSNYERMGIDGLNYNDDDEDNETAEARKAEEERKIREERHEREEQEFKNDVTFTNIADADKKGKASQQAAETAKKEAEEHLKKAASLVGYVRESLASMSSSDEDGDTGGSDDGGNDDGW